MTLDHNGSSQGIVQMKTIDDTESGYLCYKRRDQHSQEKQADYKLFAPEFKTFNDESCDSSQHNIEYQRYH